MKRLPTTGASIATPEFDERDLQCALSELGVSEAFDDADIHALYIRIGEIHGTWLLEQEATEVEPVAKALRSTARNLIEASKLLSGHESGIRTHVEIEATSATARILALDPRVGSIDAAKELIGSLREQAAGVGHACMVAYADLSQKGTNDGRAPNLWYDDFTALLIEIAERAGIEPSVGRDRKTRQRTGWLFKAAQLLEPFLHRYMRSPSAEACAKRLERSKKHLGQVKRQKPPMR
jgi:hypothetical protein